MSPAMHAMKATTVPRQPVAVCGNAPQIRPGREMADRQATMQALNIGMLTALKAPKLIGDYSHLMRADGEPSCVHGSCPVGSQCFQSRNPLWYGAAEHREATIRIMREFQRKLRQLSKDAAKRNVARQDFACNSFNPAIMLSSVSI